MSSVMGPNVGDHTYFSLFYWSCYLRTQSAAKTVTTYCDPYGSVDYGMLPILSVQILTWLVPNSELHLHFELEYCSHLESRMTALSLAVK